MHTLTPRATAAERAAVAAHVSDCDFCGSSVAFQRVEVGGGLFWALEAIEPGAGSDYLATWCSECGPQHRGEREVL